MKESSRLPWLLAVLAALLALRWWDRRGDDAPIAVAQAIARSDRLPANAVVSPAASGAPAAPADQADRDIDTLDPPNAFAVRVAPAPPAPPPPPPRPPPPKPFVGPMPYVPPPPVPPPPPPMQVIGTWDDGSGHSVFLAGPVGTLHGRVGDVLLNEYKVMKITPQQLVLRKMNTNHEFQLSVPAARSSLLAGTP